MNRGSSTIYQYPNSEETGFIGRREERNGLKNLLQSGHNVVTVVGAGGIGKTALASTSLHTTSSTTRRVHLDSIVLVSLKTPRLTVDGIQETAVAVDDMDRLMNDFASATGSVQPIWSYYMGHSLESNEGK